MLHEITPFITNGEVRLRAVLIGGTFFLAYDCARYIISVRRCHAACGGDSLFLRSYSGLFLIVVQFFFLATRVIIKLKRYIVTF